MHRCQQAVAKAAAAKATWYNERHSYRQLRRRKVTEFWQTKLQSETDRRRAWQMVDVLLGRGRVSASTAMDVEAFNRFFVDEVAKVRSSTSNALLPTRIVLYRLWCVFATVHTTDIDDVIDAVRRLPDKSCAVDPIPTNVLKQIVDLIAPYIVELFNRSLSAGHFPAGFKEAVHTLLPPERNNEVLSKLRKPLKYPVPYTQEPKDISPSSTTPWPTSKTTNECVLFFFLCRELYII